MRRLRVFFAGTPGKDPLPEQAFGLDVERAGEIVEDEQFRIAHEHAGGSAALNLSTRQAHAPRPHHRLQSFGHRRQIAFQHRSVNRAGQIDLFLGQAQEDIVAQCLAKEPRHLSGIGAARGGEEGGRIGHKLPVPEDLPRLGGHQAQEGFEQRGLARSDLSGDHRKGAARQIKIDIVNPGDVVAAHCRNIRTRRGCRRVHFRLGWIGITQPDHAQLVQAILCPVRCIRGDRRVGLRIERMRSCHRGAGCALHQVFHALERDAHLVGMGDHIADNAHPHGDGPDVGGEEGKVPNRKGIVHHGLGRDQQDQPGADGGGAAP